MKYLCKLRRDLTAEKCKADGEGKSYKGSFYK